MKRVVSFFTFVLVVLSSCFLFVSCNQLESSNGLTYGKKYIYKYKDSESNTENYTAIIFNRDGTGTYKYFAHQDYLDNRVDYTKSGTISFIWEKTSDNAIHLFKTSVKYNSDHSDGYEISLTSKPLYFSKNMIYYSYVFGSQYGTSSDLKQYLLEGSDLYEATYGED